jgi:hypothetical protein
MPQLLIETSKPSAFVMTEARAQKGSGRMVARGEFGRVGVPTQNACWASWITPATARRR